MNKYIILLCLITHSSWAFSKEKLNTVYDYMSARQLSEDNIQMNIGFTLLNPPHSFKNSVFQKGIIQLEYRKEKRNTYTPPLLLKTELGIDFQKKLQSIAFYPGIQLPKTHRKTPVYIGISIGSLLDFSRSTKVSFILKLTGSFRLYQWTHSTSSLLHLDVNYKLNTEQWWRTPDSLVLSTGLNINI